VVLYLNRHGPPALHSLLARPQETAMTEIPPLEVFEGFVADYVAVLHHVMPNRDYFPTNHRVRTALLHSLDTLTIDLPALTIAVAWVCHTLTGSLSPDEIRVRDASWRLSDAIHGMRVVHQPSFLRSDGSSD
jgi:hypothetical protein